MTCAKARSAKRCALSAARISRGRFRTIAARNGASISRTSSRRLLKRRARKSQGIRMGWRAEILLSFSEGTYHLYATTEGDTADDALAGAQEIYAAWANGHQSFIRALPTVSSDVDFDTKQTRHRGFVRFSFLPGPLINSNSRKQTNERRAESVHESRR